jgi:hypothetical protein
VLPLDGKAPIGKWKTWQSEPQDPHHAARLPWEDATGVGIVSGIGDWRCIDIDDCTAWTPVERILDGLGLPHTYPWVVESGSGAGYHIWVRCGEDDAFAGHTDYKPRGAGDFDHIELRWRRHQTAVPPSVHPDTGALYEFAAQSPDGPPIEVSAPSIRDALRSVARRKGSTDTEKTPARSNQAPRDVDVDELESALGAIPSRPDYLEWIRIIQAVQDGAPDDGTAERLLKDWSPEEEDGEYGDKLDSFEPGDGTTVGTLFWKARKHGWSGKAPTAPKDKDTPAMGDGEAGAVDTHRVTPSVESGGSFWYVANEGTEREALKIDRGQLLRFLQANGFGKLYVESDDASTYVRVVDHVVSRTSTERMADFVMQHVRSLSPTDVDGEYGPHDVEGALLRGANVYFGDSLMRQLPALDVEFQSDEPGTSFFYYRNGYVEVTGDGFTFHDYSDLGGVVWESEVLDRDFHNLRDAGQHPREWDWGRFLYNVAGQDEHREQALLTAIGYLLHGYKDPAESKAVVFMDEVDSDVPDGRTGKSLVGKAVGKMTAKTRIDARNFSFDTRFAFQDVRLGTRVVDFNDAGERFRFNRLFSQVTDDWSVERKGRDRMTIPFEDAPKVLITTNYVLEGQGASFEDRVFQVEFAPHYSPQHRPTDEFGDRFFDGWDRRQWAEFDNVMMSAVSRYLTNGLFDYRRVNVEYRRLKQNTCPDFAEWATDFIELGRRYEKDALWRTFKEQYSPDYGDLTKRKLDYWMRTFANIYDLDVKRKRLRDNGTRKRYVIFQ